MKIFIVLGLLVVYANASKLSNVIEKFIPSFTTGYIINGQDAAPHSAPYIVSWGYNADNHTHFCGGTLIDKDWIVTAAHCIRERGYLTAVAGLHKLDKVDNYTQSRKVDFVKVHESYIGRAGPFDIALFHVSQSFEINEWVQPATLPTREKISEGVAHLYGWGKYDPNGNKPANTLQTVKTQIVPWNECREILPESAQLVESNICSDSLQKGISACHGDSGGPLVQERPKAPAELIGIVSWGYVPCGEGNFPSIYTRVSAYIDWITRIQSAYYKIFKP